MSRSESAIFTNLCMVYDSEGRILVQDRTDPSWPGICFPGGHVEPNESFVESVIREVREETGLTIENPILCGTKQFQTDNGERYVVLLYKTNRFSGTLRFSNEGQMLWLYPSELPQHNLSGDFEALLKVFTDDHLSEFVYDWTAEGWKYRLL